MWKEFIQDIKDHTDNIWGIVLLASVATLILCTLSMIALVILIY